MMTSADRSHHQAVSATFSDSTVFLHITSSNRSSPAEVMQHYAIAVAICIKIIVSSMRFTLQQMVA